MKQSITQEEATELAREIFTAPVIDEYLAARDKYLAVWDKFLTAWDKYRAVRDRYWEAWDKCRAVASIRYKTITILNEYKAFNIAAADRDGLVYCFALNRREIGVYNMKDGCPDFDTVEKIDWGG